MESLRGRRILLILTGGIAAYKSLELIRLLRKAEARVRCILTAAAARFVTPLSVAALTEDKVYQDLFSLTDEAEMGHIRLSREADLVLVAPATANVLAKMAAGIADDLATTALLATDKPVLVAPAMNPMMWGHPATQANMETLRRRGIGQAGPAPGDTACGEVGTGRMAEPMDILAAVRTFFDASAGSAASPARAPGPAPLAGRRALVTSGPTREPIDPVRYLSNRSSGRQGHAIAAALAAAGAEVTLVTGPVEIPDPEGVTVVRIERAEEMLAACREALPVEIAVCAAAVSDWRVVRQGGQKLKKTADGPPTLDLAENPDILATLSAPGPQRPRLVIGFAAETERVLAHAQAKLRRKGCDWLLANDVSPATGTFGGADNTIHLLRRPAGGATGTAADADDAPEATVETWPTLSKTGVATRLVEAIAAALEAAQAGSDGTR